LWLVIVGFVAGEEVGPGMHFGFVLLVPPVEKEHDP
jgi:hypothetical protein